MTLRHSRHIFLPILIISSLVGHTQVKKKIREYNKTFQISLFPGISTNGIASASYYNKYSINIFGGLSAGNKVLELGLITNSNMKGSTGIQIAGLANIIGANSFLNLSLAEERTLLNTEDFQVNSKGIQLSGLLNYVLNHASGIQVTVGLNAVGNDFKGFQLAGIGNSAGGNTVGMQLAGFYNITDKSIGGFQISTLFNYAGQQLSGMQLGLINKARIIEGEKTSPPTRARGLQIGLVNFSQAMDGLQIGLINFGGAFRGKQFGLINFFNKSGTKEQARNGTPVGLLNFGSAGTYVRLYYSEMFTANAEISTGNCLNCTHIFGSNMPYYDRNKIYNQNALIFGYDSFREMWGFGYGFQKVLYNKFSIMPKEENEKRMISYGLKFLHLNRVQRFDKDFNLVTKLNVEYGKRKYGVHFFTGLSINYFLQEDKRDKETYEINSLRMSGGKLFGLSGVFWPGYVVGAHF
jgi:hypothetical protein